MGNLMTKEYVSQIQFFQMPKAFFQDCKYMPMRIEAKVAYTLLLDLLPLSIKNNWVNENNEVYVKLSRTKLMALLNVKGTQKAAQIMKELVDYKLIMNKKLGLGKCNQIYLYPLEGQVLKEQTPSKAEPKTARPKAPEEIKSKPTKHPVAEINIAHLIPSPTDLEDAVDEVKDLLENQIHIEDLKQKYDPDFVEEVGNNICEMFLNISTPIGKQDKPMSIIRGVIRKLQMHHIEHVIDQFMVVTRNTKVFNPKGYIQSMIYNSVFETNIRVAGDIRREFGYCC